MNHYYSVDALNFSFLKFFLNADPFYSISQWEQNKDNSRLYFEEREHLNRGSLLDCLVTTPELYDDYYSDKIIEKKPPDKLKSVIKYLFDTRQSDLMYDLDDETILSALDNEEFYHSNRKENGKLEAGGRDEEWRIQQVFNWEDYWEFLYETKGKTLLSRDEIDLALKGYNHIMEKYETIINNSHKQVAIYQKMFGFSCKGLLDLLYEHNGKLYVIDLKSTSEPLYKIPYLLKDKKWVFQVVWYSLLLKKKYPEQTVGNPSLLISSTTDLANPQLVTISTKDLMIALSGNEKTPGIIGAIENYKAYLNGKRFKYDKSNLWK